MEKSSSPGSWDTSRPSLTLLKTNACNCLYDFCCSPEKLNCLWIEVAGVSWREARWIYQPTNKSWSLYITNVYEDQAIRKLVCSFKKKTWNNGHRSCSWSCKPSPSSLLQIWFQPPEKRLNHGWIEKSVGKMPRMCYKLSDSLPQIWYHKVKGNLCLELYGLFVHAGLQAVLHLADLRRDIKDVLKNIF